MRLPLLFLLVLTLFSDASLARCLHLLSVDFLYLVVGFIAVAHIIVSAFALVSKFEIEPTSALLRRLLMTQLDRRQEACIGFVLSCAFLMI